METFSGDSENVPHENLLFDLDYDSLMESATDALEQSSYSEALEYLNKAFESRADLSPLKLNELYNTFGLAYYGSKMFNEAVLSFRKSIEAFPELISEPYENLVATYGIMGEYEKLLDVCDLIAPKFPFTTIVWYYVARANENLASYDIARVAYQNAIAGGKNECVNDLCNLLIKMNDDGKLQ
jgi:tetratricopeptide (TPR) repeat protein